MSTRQRLNSISSRWSACWVIPLLCCLIQTSLWGQIQSPILLTEGIGPVAGGQIHLDTSCLTCSPQQVSICAKSIDQVLFSGTVLQYSTMVSALDSSNQIGLPSLTQGSAAHYLISLDQQIGSGSRLVSVIESVAAGFGAPEQVSEGPEDQHSSEVTILDSGHRVVSWIRSDANTDTVMMKYGVNPPVELGSGSVSHLCPVGGDSVVICWLDGTQLWYRVADSGSISSAMELYDLLSVPTYLELESDALGNLQIATLLGDQLLLLQGSISSGITDQQVINNRANGLTHLSFDSLATDRFCICWIQDDLIWRYTFNPGGIVVSGTSTAA